MNGFIVSDEATVYYVLKHEFKECPSFTDEMLKALTKFLRTSSINNMEDLHEAINEEDLIILRPFEADTEDTIENGLKHRLYLINLIKNLANTDYCLMEIDGVHIIYNLKCI